MPEAKRLSMTAPVAHSAVALEAPAGDALQPTGRPPARPRLDSVDLLRGLVMVLMALDHTRDYFSNATSFDPTDLTKTNAALFVTRWVTHFCAPVFVFLAGTGIFLSGARGKSKPELARFLLTRGLWLVLLELTLVKLGFDFTFDYHLSYGLVIWALGWSMVAMAGLIFLPVWAVAAFGVALIVGHNAFDGVKAESLGAFRWLWMILHEPGLLTWAPGRVFLVGYPLVPWVGVMAAGYGCGRLLTLEPARRRALLLRLGVGLMLAFVALRASRVYGDPRPWSAQPDWLFTLFSFVNCQKYPPSLLYLLMTLGPALVALALFRPEAGRWARPFVIFGRVPLFYYLLHLPLIHGAAVAVALFRYGTSVPSLTPGQAPPDWGFGLPAVYLAWALVVLALYPACRWFAGLKGRRRDRWLSYL